MTVRVISYNNDNVIVRMTLKEAIKFYQLDNNDVVYILAGGSVCDLPYHYKDDYIELDN